MHPDELKLTAYALNEIEPTDEVIVKQHLENCAACQQAVEETRRLAGLLSEQLAKEPCPERSVSLPQSAITLQMSAKRRSLGRFGWTGVSVATAAALFVIAALLLPAFQNSSEQRALLAKSQAEPTDNSPLDVLGTGGTSVPTAHPIELTKTPTGAVIQQQLGRLAADPTGATPNSLAYKDQPQRGFSTASPSLTLPTPYWQSNNLGYVPTKAELRLDRSSNTFTGGTTITAGSARKTELTVRAYVSGVTVNAGTVIEVPAINVTDPQPMDQFNEPVHNTEAYDRIDDNPFREVREHPLSTFSIDVDTASYSNVRRFLTSGTRPTKDAVRIEELLNYFPYDYAPPKDDKPFASHVEMAECPWNREHRLLRIALKGREMPENERPLSNLVFLLDVSGSMQPENKLPLVKQAMQMLVKRLGENDRVAIVVYAGASGLVLASTTCDHKETIGAALENLQAGGSTNGASGIQLAYEQAEKNFIKAGTNRVILCTDGDFNVGITDSGSLTRLIEEKAASGVFLSVLGFGMGNLKDATLESLADRGNGNYAYIDTPKEAKKLLVDQLSGTLVTIAKDVKIQIEFNPSLVSGYRLIGYENRVLAAEDFNNDKKDAGEIGAGHTVTALYEIVPAGQAVGTPAVDPLKYQQPAKPAAAVAGASPELLTLKLRYKEPTGETSRLVEYPFTDSNRKLSDSSKDFRFAAAVAEFGMLLRNSPHKGNATFDTALELAQEGKGADADGYRAEFLQLIGLAKQLRN
jgi:Ca-activated chloride channel family protein